MAVAVGNQALASDIQSWYNTLNSILTSYGGTIGTASPVPAQKDQIEDTHINNMANKLHQAESDTFLRYATYPTYTTVVEGELIATTPGLYLQNAATTGEYPLNTVRCRNTANNASGFCSSGILTNGKNSCGANTSGKRSHGSDSNTTQGADHVNSVNGTHGGNYVCFIGSFFSVNNKTTFSNGFNSVGNQSSGDCSSGVCSSTGLTNTQTIDIFCANTTMSNASRTNDGGRLGRT